MGNNDIPGVSILHAFLLRYQSSAPVFCVLKKLTTTQFESQPTHSPVGRLHWPRYRIQPTRHLCQASGNTSALWVGLLFSMKGVTSPQEKSIDWQSACQTWRRRTEASWTETQRHGRAPSPLCPPSPADPPSQASLLPSYAKARSRPPNRTCTPWALCSPGCSSPLTQRSCHHCPQPATSRRTTRRR